MKNVARNLFTFLLAACTCISCVNNHNNSRTSLKISESERYYKVYAVYPEENTRRVAHYMNKKIGDGSNVSFTNTSINAQLTLNDGTKLYVKNKPGELEIQFDKNVNTYAAYQRMKSFGEGLKPVLNAQ